MGGAKSSSHFFSTEAASTPTRREAAWILDPRAFLAETNAAFRRPIFHMNEELQVAIAAAREAGALLREHFGKPLEVDQMLAHDIKLALDVESQALITARLLGAFPEHALYGEEGIAGHQASEWQWIVDPIDGTVNYFYGIPHFCVSIALRRGEELQLGVIYDPMRDELWQVEHGGQPTLNGQPIAVSTRTQLGDAMLSVGFAKSNSTIRSGLPLLAHYVQRVRKCRMMGSAA